MADELQRCDASDVVEVLIEAAEPESRLLLARPLLSDVSCIAWVTTSSLWRVSLLREPGEGLTQTLDAWAPDGRYWEHGCQRRWLGDGSVIDPLDQMSAEQRVALDLRLMRANCWPDSGFSPMPDYVS